MLLRCVRDGKGQIILYQSDIVEKCTPRQGYVHAAFGSSTRRGARQQARGHVANENGIKCKACSPTLVRSPLYFRQRPKCIHACITTCAETFCGIMYHARYTELTER